MYVATTKFFGSFCAQGATQKEVIAQCKRMGMSRKDFSVKKVA